MCIPAGESTAGFDGSADPLQIFYLALVGVRLSTGMDSEPTDKDLLSQLSTDPAAFETFYWRHLDRVIGFTARRVREPADVANVVAATFLAVLTAARSYDPRRQTHCGLPSTLVR